MQPQEIAFDLANKMLNAQIGAETIIAGLDITGAHIFKIHDPGIATCLDTPFFACSGIGEGHATSQFMLAKFNKRWSVEKTIFLTYSAKRLAEAAAGVGKETDMVLIRLGAPEPIYALTKEELGLLEQYMEGATAKADAAREEAYESIRNYMEEKRKKADESKTSGEGGESEDK